MLQAIDELILLRLCQFSPARYKGSIKQIPVKPEKYYNDLFNSRDFDTYHIY